MQSCALSNMSRFSVSAILALSTETFTQAANLFNLSILKAFWVFQYEYDFGIEKYSARIHDSTAQTEGAW
jgi:hypothetical protein